MSQSISTKSTSTTAGTLQHPVPEFLKQGRNNPINGTDCFFSERTFRRVVGQEMCFRDKFMIHAARAKEALQKTKKEKKRQKDFDMPSLKEQEANLSKPSCTENATATSASANNLKPPDGISSDGDESEADLVIADEEEQNSVTARVSKVSPVHECTEIRDDKTNQTVEENDLQVQDSVPAAEVIPHYTAGITSLNFLPGAENNNTGSQENTSSTTTKQDTHETHSDSEEVMCLVMPALTSESDENCSADNDKTVPQGSTLPLIPALMSEPTGVHKTRMSHSTVDLMTPKTTSLFYNSDQFVDYSVKETSSNSEKPCSKLDGKTEENEANQSDGDVPIFSLAGTTSAASPDTGAKRSQRNKGIWTSGVENQQNTNSQKSNSKDNSVKDFLKFKQSSLTRSQMSTYLELFEKYARPYLHGGRHPMFTERQKKEMADFEALQGRVQSEQREFQSYLQQNALRNPQFYTFIRSHAKHYAYTKIQSYRPPKSLVTKFSNKFVSEVPLQAGAERMELTFHRHLLEMGLPPRVLLPDLVGEKKPVQVLHIMKKIEHNFPSTAKYQEGDVLHHESISEDKNAEALAIKYRSEAVLSSSVVKCLLDNRAPHYKRSWNIPVSVKEHHTEDGVQKVVYLNKPIYEDNLLLRDCNALFHKYALRSMVSQSKHPPAYKSSRQQKRPGNSGQKNAKQKIVDDPFDMFGADLEALETFGKASFGRKGEAHEPVNPTNDAVAETNCRRSKRLAEAQSEKDDSLQNKPTEETDNFSEALASIQNKPANVPESLNADLNQKKESVGKHPFPAASQNETNFPGEVETLPTTAKKLRVDASVPNVFLDDKLKLSPLNTASPSKSTRSRTRLSSVPPRESLIKKSAGHVMQSERPNVPFFGNVQASSSNPLDLILGPNVPEVEKKTNLSAAKENPSHYTPHSEPLSSLLYSQWQLGKTNILIRTRSHGTFKTRPVYLTAKMEYQASHGVEQVTAEEIVRDWAACYIRPNSKLVRARINAFTSEIIMFQELEGHQILKPSSSFRPNDGFTFIHNLLSHLTSLVPGSYLVSHEPGQRFCGIRTLKHGARLDNIEKPLPIPPEKKLSKDTVPWIPIDPTVLLPYHTLHQRIPATFLPRDVVITPGAKKPDQASVIATLKGKKKKKKKNKFKKKGDQEFF